MNLLEIINHGSAGRLEIYLYEENGKWFAHEHSVSLLQALYPDIVAQRKSVHPLLSAIRKRVEVDLNELLAMRWFIALCSDEEILLIKTD